MYRSQGTQKKFGIMVILIFALFTFLSGQDEIKGPVIQEFGATYDVPDATYDYDYSRGMKVVFDITSMGNKPTEVSSQINTIARCINMHAHDGVDIASMDIYAVFHSNGTYTILNDGAYEERYGTSNPHNKLLDALHQAGVKLYVCGQSLSARKVPREDLHPAIEISLSAMTIFMDLQIKGYAMMKM